MGSIAQALLAHGNPAYDEAESSTWQAAQVSTLSLANFCGRILIGIIADTAKSRLRIPRSFCLPLVSTLFILSQLVLIAIGDVHHLWTASTLVGLAYGCWFGLLPTISIEWFGLGTWKRFPLSLPHRMNKTTCSSLLRELGDSFCLPDFGWKSILDRLWAKPRCP